MTSTTSRHILRTNYSQHTSFDIQDKKATTHVQYMYIVKVWASNQELEETGCSDPGLVLTMLKRPASNDLVKESADELHAATVINFQITYLHKPSRRTGINIFSEYLSCIVLNTVQYIDLRINTSSICHYILVASVETNTS